MYELGFCCLSVCVCTEFKISCKILNMLFVCLFVGVSDFVLMGKDALQSEIVSSVTIPWCLYFVQTFKAKQVFRYVEFDEISEVDTHQTKLRSNPVEKAQY
jgi:hypothetical protein